MSKLLVVSALAATLAMTSVALAESTNSTTPSHRTAANTPNEPNPDQGSVLKGSQIKQELQQAGFSDIKILEDAFVVRAKTKDGNAVVMTIGPNGMSAVEMMQSGAENRAGTPGSQPTQAGPAPNSQTPGQKAGEH